jgi:2-polyprenyl-3-methyl-5-hydroxy-6-metoxy-1,4-benzoquinol methylase
MSTEGRDILCPVCGSPAADGPLLSGPDLLHSTPGTFHVAACSSCGCGWTLPPASSAELEAFYPETYAAHLLERGLLGAIQERGQRLILHRALARLPLRALRERTPGELLDVGCGRGDLGAELIRRGWQVAGVDPSAAAAVTARMRGLDASVGTLQSVGYASESFDAVVMNHTLEHVPDPVADLARAFRVLRPGGLLLISVPNFASWQRGLFGSKWYPLDLPRHRTHFTQRSLRLALETAKFDIVACRTTSDSAVLAATLQYVLAGRQLLTHGPGAWSAYAFHALLSPLNRVVDLVHGERAFVDAVAQRPPVEAVG